MSERLTTRQCAILTAFTGILLGRMEDFHTYAEEVLGRPIWTHEFASPELWDKLKDASRPHVFALMPPGVLTEQIEKGPPEW